MEMKKHLLFLTILLWAGSHVFSQNVEFYATQENVETIIKNPDLVLLDPQIMDYYFDIPGSLEFPELLTLGDVDLPGSGGLDNFNIYGEFVVTPNNIMLRVPFRYTLGNLRLSVSIPYYFHRSLAYTHGKVSTRGLGDIQTSLVYRLRSKSFRSEFIADAKLPTGNHNKQIQGFLVPLGTGSYDFSLGNISNYRINRFSVIGNANYRISGSHHRLVQITYADIDETELIDYTITNGNTLTANLVFNYRLGYGVALMAGASVLNNSDGSFSRTHTYNWDKPKEEYSNLSAQQDFTYVDLNLGLTYNIFGFNFFANFRPPLYTLYNEVNTDKKREPMFYFKVSRKIF